VYENLCRVDEEVKVRVRREMEMEGTGREEEGRFVGLVVVAEKEGGVRQRVGREKETRNMGRMWVPCQIINWWVRMNRELLSNLHWLSTCGYEVMFEGNRVDKHSFIVS